MKQRGRKSATALATAAVVIDIRDRLPPRPPAELDTDERRTWRDIVRPYPLVGSRAVRGHCWSNIVGMFRGRGFWDAEISRLGPTEMERFCRLANQARQETRAILSLSKALRLSPSSRMHARTAARKFERMLPPGSRPPWATGG